MSKENEKMERKVRDFNVVREARIVKAGRNIDSGKHLQFSFFCLSSITIHPQRMRD